MNKETSHPKFGSKVRLINKPVWVGAYEEGETGVVVAHDALGFSATLGHVHVVLDYGYKRIYSIPHGQYELMQDAVKGTPQEILNGNDTVLCINSAASATTAESLRNSILDIRSKREALQKEILQLDEQEKEAVEKLKELGFILYEDSVSKEAVATERKAELYAEDIEEGMADPRNWRVGDIVECIKKEWITFEEFNIGAKYEIVEIDIGSDGVWVSLVDAAGDLMAVPCKEFKFHSRPIK